jgi:hypothetical protein
MQKTPTVGAPERGFAVCFPPSVSMVYSLKVTFDANDGNLTSIGLTPGEIICFGSLEFTVDCFGNLSLSPEGNDPGVTFEGMVHSGLLSLHTVLEQSSVIPGFYAKTNYSLYA